MQLKPFQRKASTQIAERFLRNLPFAALYRKGRRIPFYQNLSAITGSGKTLMLADAIAHMTKARGANPIVLWLSKAKAVVWQTYANLANGPYAELLQDFQVKPLHQCKPSDLARSDEALLLVATVGKFNQKDKEQGDRRIFQIEWDKADRSLWEQLKTRQDARGERRPLWIVYDESHNLTQQQAELLLELEPEALLLASATQRLPEMMKRDIERMLEERDWGQDDWVTEVETSKVVEAGLIKQHIYFSGYVAPMEEAIDHLLTKMQELEQQVNALQLDFLPKAIYISNTNIVSKSQQDNIHVEFEQRLARPILIWRYLVEQKGIDPSAIAVYCNLKFDPKYPPPATFQLFNGGAADFDALRSGPYRHIIFNLSLQEGWDDPECYLAYIDKGMASSDQIAQVVGRVLRQPGAKHYPAQELNTAYFYLRTDEKSVIGEVLQEIKEKLLADKMPESTFRMLQSGQEREKLTLPPRFEAILPQVDVSAPNAEAAIQKILDGIHDFRGDERNTAGFGERLLIRQKIGNHEPGVAEWAKTSNSSRVTARYLLKREIQKHHAEVLNYCNLLHPKFSAAVGFNSPAAEHLRQAAEKVVQAYLDRAEVVQSYLLSDPVGSVMAYGADPIAFRHSVHERYGGMNKLEKTFALAIDETGCRWLRNQSRGLFELPLLDHGDTKHFNPDFLVWTEANLVAIDTKGDHLIRGDAARKLFHVKKIGPGPQLRIRLVTEGRWRNDYTKESYEGYTVWTLKNGRPYLIHAETPQEAVQICLQDSSSESLL